LQVVDEACVQRLKPKIVALAKEVLTPVVIFGWLATSLVVALAGPFGTFETQPLTWRLAYWTGLNGVAIIIAFGCRFFWRGIIKGDPWWLEDLAVIGSLSVLFGPILVTLNTWLAGPEISTGVDLFLATFITFAVGLTTVVLRRFMQLSIASAAPRRDKLLDRISAPEGARLGRVWSDNHHIVVRTTDGTDYRILMRLRDAVNEIDVEPGYCVHRSHWLATSQITEIEREQGREIIKMPCGASVPVGPKYRPELVEAGFLNA